jgi:hypothetical protein
MNSKLLENTDSKLAPSLDRGFYTIRFFALLKYARQIMPVDNRLKPLLYTLFLYAYTEGWIDRQK